MKLLYCVFRSIWWSYKKVTCKHEFFFEDLELTFGTEEETLRLYMIDQSVADRRVNVKCCICEERLFANCGLDIKGKMRNRNAEEELARRGEQ